MAEPRSERRVTVALEALRVSGIEAYRRLHEAVTDEAALERYLDSVADKDAPRVRETVRGLPLPVKELPLWVVAALAAHAVWGVLEDFYTMGPDGSPVADAQQAASAPLRAWLEAHRDELEFLLLVPPSIKDVSWRDWEPRTEPGGWVDIELLLSQRAREVADEFPVAWEVAVALVLLRDWHLDLAPLLDALGLDPDEAVLQARHWLDDRAAVVLDGSAQQKMAPGPTLKPPARQAASEIASRAEQAVAWYTERLGSPLPTLRPDSAWGLLLVFADPHLGAPPTLVEALADEDRVLAALREASAAASKGTAPTARGYRPSATVSTDLWTTEDLLGAALYADAIAEFICHPDTRPPLTIGIKGPWGAGKTSLMRMVRERLDPGANRGAAPLVKAGDAPEAVEVTNRAALRRTAADVRTGADAGEEPPMTAHFERAIMGERLRPTVWFNPWTYQSGEHLWAGLAQAIIDGVTGRMSAVQRERFWFELNIRRIDRWRVRRHIHRLLFERVLPVLLPGAALLLAAFAVWALFPRLSGLVPGGLSLAGVAALIGAAWRAVRFLQGGVSVSLDELVRQPDYEGSAGILHLVQQDMRRVLALVATPKRPLVVFVDDLDRCNADVVVQVIEALNLFLAGQYPNCVFVLALEPDVVAAHLEVGRADLLKVLADHLPSGSHFGMGWRFLDKMVQMPLRLPSPEPPQMDVYIDGVLGKPPERRHLDHSAVQRRVRRLNAELSSVEELRTAAAAVEAAERGEEPGRVSDGGRSGDQEGEADDDRPGPLHEETIRAAELAFAERLRDDAPEVREVIRGYAPYLARNPREVKRFINLFRFYAFVQVRRELRDLPAPTLAQVGKMAILAIRWPYLLSVLNLAVPADRTTTVLAHLEQAADDAATWGKAAAATGLRDKMHGLIAADEDLRRVMANDPPLADVIGFL